MIIIKAFLSKPYLTRLIWPNRDIDKDAVDTICSLNVKLIRVVKINAITPKKAVTAIFLSICLTTSR